MSESYIYWQMYLPKALQYYHSSLRRAGALTVSPTEMNERVSSEQSELLREKLQAILKEQEEIY